MKTPIGSILPALPNTFALIYDMDNDTDGLQSFPVVAWRLTYEYCRSVGRTLPKLLPIGESGELDVTKPHAIKIGSSILANGIRYLSADEWLETYYPN
jgi:hypothetical protein